MKIIGGTLKGRNFYMPKDIRPTQNIFREAVFDILGHDLSNVEFLELFAGSGSVGIEALSRGAAKVMFVEKDGRCAEVINKNLRLFGIDPINEEKADVINSDAFAMIKRLAAQGRKFDIVFLDPPFGLELAKKTLKTLMAYDILHHDSIVMVQHSKRETLPELEGRFLIIRQRKYGSAYLTVLKKDQERTS